MTNEQNKTMSEEVEVNETAELTDEKTVEAVFEEGVTDASDITENPVEELQSEIESLKSKLTEAENRYLRLHADFDNYRRRTRLEQEANEKYRSQKLIIDLLPAIDNFERALKMEAENEQNKSLLQGMDMVYRGLLEALKKEGVEPIEAVGAEFDPHKHQAVMQGEDANYGSNIVTDEFQKGYVLKDRVIRPSMVKVNQ